MSLLPRVRTQHFLRIFFVGLMLSLWAWGCGPEDDSVSPRGSDQGCEGDAAFDPGYRLLSSGNPVQDKNYYLLTLFQQVQAVRAEIDRDPSLKAFGGVREDRLRESVQTCAADVDCYAEALLVEEGVTEEIGDALVRAFMSGTNMCTLIEGHMRPSGMFERYASTSDEEILRNAWMDTVEGLRIAFDAYARSLESNLLAEIVWEVSETNPGPLPFYEPLLQVVMATIQAQGRDEAGRYEPLREGENRPAAERLPYVNWNDYLYTSILVPGQGPVVEGVPLSPLGKFRCQLAAERFFDNQAPFITVSGGHVHPDRTPYSEAMEMKQYLQKELGVPENAIFVDPHARHTTTNLRNFSRILFRYGLPTDRDALVTTDMFQAIYIAYLLDDRCLNELGYLPYREVNPISVFDSRFLPDMTSLHAETRDPLDP